MAEQLILSLEPKPLKKVVYLIGAGASHACAKAVGSAHGILMRDLGPQLASGVRELVDRHYATEQTLRDLVNAIITDETDFEHVITFLDESPSALHRKFADDLRKVFENILRQRLDDINHELGAAPVGLYQALLDMYEVQDCPEQLSGILTLNYDGYIEEAVNAIHECSVDFGIDVRDLKSPKSRPRLLKLHGSFGWHDAWPIPSAASGSPLWIPPGIQKAKDRYPFNVLWGLARELLDCDILRIVGCRLAPNDWDLISLLFTTRHATSTHQPYAIEVIDSPEHAIRLQETFPYLEVRSLLEIEPIGKQFIAEFTGAAPRGYKDLTPEEFNSVVKAAGTDKNWFLLWLTQMAEAWFADLGSLATRKGAFQKLMETSQ